MSEPAASLGPTFLIIGAARSGTTALTRFLSQHPDVFVTSPKEPHFFAFANSAVRFRGPGDDEMMNRRIVRSPSAYWELYQGASGRRHRGEGSVSTLFFSDTSIPNIRTYAPDVRLILSLRYPADRAYSSYLYLRSRGHEPLASFADALDAEPARSDAGWHHMWRYRALGNYAQQVEPFIEAFGRDRLLVVTNEHLRRNPDSVMTSIAGHLGLAPFRFNVSEQVNRGGEARRAWLADTMNLFRASAPLNRVAKLLSTERFRERVRAVNLAYPQMDAVVADELRDYFAPDIERLESLLDLSFPEWKAQRQGHL